MKLSSDQLNNLKQWIEQGFDLSAIQTAMEQNWKIPITFMEVRFLLDDYDLTLKKEEKKSEVKPEATAVLGETPQVRTGQVTATLSKVRRPGTVANGTVTFSDGITADWQLDEMGRLGLVPIQAGYRPSQTDIEAFQVEIEKLLR
jgi:hypothetical protein